MVDRVRKLAEEVLNRYPNLFNIDFEENKTKLSEIAMITSKQLKNELAGYITKIVKRRLKQEEVKVEEEAEVELEEKVSA
ncbi:MAG: hypothetical protein QXX95_03055 [Nitrososphaerales archaeon]